MSFSTGRSLQYYYGSVIILMAIAIIAGAIHFWNNGILNIDYMSSLYEATNMVKAAKDRNDIIEIGKYVDADQIKDANRAFLRIETDVKSLRPIKSTLDVLMFDTSFNTVKQNLITLQSGMELSTILNNMNNKVSAFETFVTERNWPTLRRMSANLRMRLLPSRVMSNGLYNFERTKNLNHSISNDLEAMINFTKSSGLRDELKIAIVNRIKALISEAQDLVDYVEGHDKFNRNYKDFKKAYESWFKLVEPEIAFKKIDFEKSSQAILYYMIAGFTSLILLFVLGTFIYNYQSKNAQIRTEKLIVSVIKDHLLPNDGKNPEKFSTEFYREFEKYRDYTHRRMSLGLIFQEALPFPAILLDSNLNVLWANGHFYESWELKNFKDGSESLSWDFLQRFTNLDSSSSVLNALRMNASGSYKIEVKSHLTSMSQGYEMHVSPVDYHNQKRIMIMFYPLDRLENSFAQYKKSFTNVFENTLDLHLNEMMTVKKQSELRNVAEENGIGEIYSMLSRYVEKNNSINDDLRKNIELLEMHNKEHMLTITELNQVITNSTRERQETIKNYIQLKNAILNIVDLRDQLEEEFKCTINFSRELFKDQNKVFMYVKKAEDGVNEYVKSLKSMATLKNQFKDLSTQVSEFKSRIVQTLDQMLIFQDSEHANDRLDQFLSRTKFELKGFEKVLNQFSEVVTQLDVTVTKIDMITESRDTLDLEELKTRTDSLKNSLDNIQFSFSKVTQSSHAKDDEIVSSLHSMAQSLKGDSKRANEMCEPTVGNSYKLPDLNS